MSLHTRNILAVGVLISTSLCLEIKTLPRQELFSECVCWSLIFACGQTFFYFRSKPSQSSQTSEIAVIASGVSLLCLTYTFQQMIWSLVSPFEFCILGLRLISLLQAPLLPLALIMIERRGGLLPEYEQPEGENTNWNWYINRNNIILGVYVAITTITLFRDDPFPDFQLKLCWIFAQVVLYWGLLRRGSKLNGIKFDDMVEVWHTATELAGWVALVTTSLAILGSHHISSIPQIGIFGVLKAGRWIAVLVLVRHSLSSLRL